MSPLTAEQAMLQATLRKFLSTKSSEADVRQAMASEDGYDRGIWRLMGVEIGVQGIAIPELSWRRRPRRRQVLCICRVRGSDAT